MANSEVMKGYVNKSELLRHWKEYLCDDQDLEKIKILVLINIRDILAELRPAPADSKGRVD